MIKSTLPLEKIELPICVHIFILFSITPIFLSIELVEFVGKCILEEIFQWIECKEVENLAFKDVNVDQLSDVLSTSTEDLINKGFTIFQAVHDFYKGAKYLVFSPLVPSER